jgi:hypothetical protein
LSSACGCCPCSGAFAVNASFSTALASSFDVSGSDIPAAKTLLPHWLGACQGCCSSLCQGRCLILLVRVVMRAAKSLSREAVRRYGQMVRRLCWCVSTSVQTKAPISKTTHSPCDLPKVQPETPTGFQLKFGVQCTKQTAGCQNTPYLQHK